MVTPAALGGGTIGLVSPREAPSRSSDCRSTNESESDQWISAPRRIIDVRSNWT